MKKILTGLIVGTIISLRVVGASVKHIGNDNDGLGALRNEIRKLETELEQKTDTLNKCAEKNKNFQIAGIATIGLTGVGIATNISMRSKIKNQEKLTENMKNKIEQVDADAEILIQEMNALSENLDEQCYRDWFNMQLNSTERARFAEVYSHSDDIEKFYDSDVKNIPESDKILFEKMIRGMRKCQNQKE